MPGNRHIRYAGHFADSWAELWALANKLGLEGIVAKDVASPYVAGPTTQWLKIETASGEERATTRKP